MKYVQAYKNISKRTCKMFHWWCSFMDTCKMCKMTSDLMSNVCNSMS